MKDSDRELGETLILMLGLKRRKDGRVNTPGGVLGPAALGELARDIVKKYILTEGGDDTNARLIAAANDMLSACEAVMEWAKTPGEHGGNPYCKKFVRMADSAISKATGVSVLS